MSITINLTLNHEKTLLERAARNGQYLEAYVHRLIDRDINEFDEALAPFRRQVADSGVSDSELEASIESVQHEVWREKQGSPRDS